MDHPGISVRADTMSGRPVIAGRRVLASSLLQAVAHECDLKAAAAVYGVDIADVKAALFYAAERIDPAAYAEMDDDDLGFETILPAAE